MKQTFESIIADFEKESAWDFIGLWELVGAVKRDLGVNESGDVQRLTLELLRRMLLRGFRAGYMSGHGGPLQVWPDQEPSHIVARVAAEWDALGHEPNISDIAWFDYPPARRSRFDGPMTHQK